MGAEMDRTTPGTNGQQKYLIALLSLAVAILLGAMFLWKVPGQGVWILICATIPSLIALLISGPVVYFLFTRYGISAASDAQMIAAPDLARELSQLIQSGTSEVDPEGLRGFFPTYKQVPWADLIASSNRRIDLVAFYYDTWAKDFHDALIMFFQKPGTTMRVFVSDPRIDSVVDFVHRLFPEYGSDEVRQKIARTGQRLAQAAREAGAHPSRFEFYYVPFPLGYSAQCWDETELSLGWFEMFRKSGIASPVVLVDLDESPTVRSFWVKEHEGLLRCAERIAVTPE